MEKKIILRGRVSCVPSQGWKQRLRGGPAGKKLRWNKTPVDVVVIDLALDDKGRPTVSPDYTASPIELTPADWQELLADPQIAASAIGDHDPEMPAARAAMADAQKKIADLQQQIADDAERRADERRVIDEAMRQRAADLEAAQGEIAALRAKLAERGRKG